MKFYGCAFIALIALSACSSLEKSRVAVDLGAEASEAEPQFQWPVYGASLTQKFRPEKHRHYRRIHEGIDLASPKNTPIYAVEHGIVSYAGHGRTGYGRLVVVEHINKRYRSYYAHLSRYKVERGDVVKKGDLVGLMGKSGRATGVHLHFEIHKDQVAVNPLDYLPTEAATARQANPQP